MSEQHTGHDTGDEVLKEIAIQLKEAVHYDDLVVRKDGDELAVIATISREESGGDDRDKRIQARVDSISERLRKGITIKPFMSKVIKKVPGFGVSVGAASFTVGSDTIMDTLRSSDEAMYKNKEQIKSELSERRAA